MPGPIPKRSDVRRRNNKPETPVAIAPAGGSPDAGVGLAPQPPAEPDWHPIAQRWYEALGASGQRCFYEPSDWAQAVLVAEGMSRMLKADRLSAQMFAAIDSASTRLLITEGDRRRMRIELERRKVVDEDEDAAVASMADWRSRLGG